MFGIGGTELIIILLFIFIVVGPDKLPEVAKTLGKAIAKFRETQDEMNEVIKKETDAIKKEAQKAEHKARVEQLAAERAAAEERAAEKPAVAVVETPDVVEESKASEEAPAHRVVRKEEVAEAAEEPKKPLSFSERKAAYERQRAEKAAAEAAAAAAEKEGE